MMHYISLNSTRLEADIDRCQVASIVVDTNTCLLDAGDEVSADEVLVDEVLADKVLADEVLAD